MPRGRVILRNANTYAGQSTISLGTVVLAHDNAFSTDNVKEDGPSGITQTGYNVDPIMTTERLPTRASLGNG